MLGEQLSSLIFPLLFQGLQQSQNLLRPSEGRHMLDETSREGCLCSDKTHGKENSAQTFAKTKSPPGPHQRNSTEKNIHGACEKSQERDLWVVGRKKGDVCPMDSCSEHFRLPGRAILRSMESLGGRSLEGNLLRS